MSWTTLLSPTVLARHLGTPDWVIVDCRFSLDDPEMGRRAYDRAHIPFAHYAHLNTDLSAPHEPGRTGRHPLPDIDALVERFGAWGITDGVQVVAYDEANGAIASRLWWLLRWLGHDAVAVLDGGWLRWRAEDRPVDDVVPKVPPQRFVPRERPELIADAGMVEAARGDHAWRVLDARARERYRGDEEPLDPVPGHIPGAINWPYAGNTAQDGTFLTAESLRDRLMPLIPDGGAGQVISYCGSGVTACHTLLAMAHAGLGDGRLYPGSWSEWITDPDRPITSGDD